MNSQEADAAAQSEDERAAQRVGSTIKGKWTLESLLGIGGMAAVYAAQHRNGQRAALKVLHADFARDKVIGERFLREAYVSNKVNHPACVKVLDDDITEDEEPFLVMELLEGETVRDAWKSAGRVMGVPQVLHIADCVLDCLAACHAIGVIHRDLKPANVFLTREGDVKVLDFGVAQMRSATAERTAAGTALGTPAYMSPEQAMGLVDQLDGRADLFSVGAMIHALVTGQRINSGRTEQEALVMAATMPAPSIARIAPHLPIDVIALVDKALAWDRRNRYTDARDMQRAVKAALAVAEGAPAREASAAPRARTRSAMGLESRPAQGAGGQGATPPSHSPHSPLESSMPPAPATRRFATSERRDAVAEELDAQLDESDARVTLARDLFRHVDRVLPSVWQMGWDHPATERALRTTFEAFAQGLGKELKELACIIRPYSFMAFGHTLWEPASPFDAVPYNLFACGMRRLVVEPGITMEELRALLALMLLDPGTDLPPEDDIAAAFWEKGLAHVRYEVVDAFAEGDATEREAFYASADELEALAQGAAGAHASRVEAKAMAVSTDRGALTGSAGKPGGGKAGARDARAPRPSPMSLDDVVRTVLSRQLELPREKWSERYVDALVEGYLDAAAQRDAPLVLASLRRSASDLVVAGRLGVIVAMHDALVERLAHRVSGEDLARLSAALTNALFGAEALELVIERLKVEASEVAAFAPVMAKLWAAELPTVLGALPTVAAGALRDLLHRFVERVLPGHEMEVATALSGVDPELSYALIGVLGRAGTPEAKRALAQLAASEDVTVRIEAKVALTSSAEQVHGELLSMLENASALMRMAAQRAIARHALKQAWPTIARQVRAPDFHALGADERRQLLRTLVVLSPERGEPLALEIVKKGGVFTSEDRETSRVLAAEALGALSRAASTASALREVAQTRWGTSDETRAAAAAAAKQIGGRDAGLGGSSAP
jgi:serine/threonine protein kinase